MQEKKRCTYKYFEDRDVTKHYEVHVEHNNIYKIDRKWLQIIIFLHIYLTLPDMSYM